MIIVRGIRSIFFYIMLFISTFIMSSLALFCGSVLKRSNWSHLCSRFWANWNLWAAGVKVRVKGVENIVKSHPYVYMANHQSWFDIFTLSGKLPVQFRWLAKEELFKIPIFGPAMLATGNIPIDRSDSRKSVESLNQAALRIRNGTSVVIFPEGTRSEDGVLQDFKKGGFILAIKSQQPIVPVSIVGSHRVMPKRGGWLINPDIIEMTLAPPMPTEGLTTRDRDSVLASVREAIRKNLTVKEGGLLHSKQDQNE